MRDEDKSKKQLISELIEMRMKIAELEGLEFPKRPTQPAEFGTVTGKTAETKSSLLEIASGEDISEWKGTLKEVLESPLKWQITFSSVSDAICWLDMEDRVLDCNEAMLKLLGKPSAEVIGKTCFKLMHSTCERVDDCPVARMRKSLARESMELRVGDQWFDVFAHPIVDEVGCLIGALHVLSDITKRKQAEESLKESETKFRTLVESIPDAITYIHALDENRTLLYVSPQVEKIVGYTAQEYIEDPDIWVGSIHPADYERVVSEFIHFEETGQHFASEYRMIRKDCGVIWIYDVADVLRDENGRPTSVIGVTFDVSHHKEIEETLRESEARYRNIFENIMEGIFQTTPEGHYLSVNPAFVRMFGYTSEEEMLKGITDIGQRLYVNPEDRERLKDLLAERGRVEAFETQVRRRDGRVIWISINARAVRDAMGEILYYEGTNEDITERKEAEEALRCSNENYRELVENTNSIILRMDNLGNITFFNEFAQRFFGYRQEEIIGRNVVGTIVPEVDSRGRQLRSVIEDLGKNPDRYINNVNENMRRNGERVWIAWTNKPLLDNNGHVLEILCIGNDITERKRAEEELQKLASVVRYSSELINLATPDGKMIFLNDAGAMALGLDPDEIEKTHIMQVIPDHLQEMVQTEILPVLMKQGKWEGELQCRNLKTCKLTDVHAIMFTISDPASGAPLYLANVASDITERKRAEESLRQSEEKFSKAFQANPASMSIASLEDGVYIDVNDSFLRITGHERSEVIGRTGKDLGLWTQNLTDDFMGTLKSVGRVSDREIQIRVKSGDLRTVCLSAELIQIKGKTCLLTVADDITEDKRAEQALQESKRQLSDIIEFLPGATLVIDRDSRVIAWNRAMEEMTGVKKEKILGRGKDALAVCVYGQPMPMLVDLLLNDGLDFKNFYDDFEKRGDTLYAEVYVPENHKGRSRHMWAIASPLYDRDGKVIGAIESIRDITERKEMERTLREREKDLEAKSLALQETNTALKVLLKHQEEDQKEFGINVLANLKELVFPYIEKLKESRLNEMQKTYIGILESHLEEISTPFLRKLATEFTNLSPMERQIASLIRDGKQNKEIAKILGISLNTISTHRYHLRTKLGVKNKDINLVSYLKSISTL